MDILDRLLEHDHWATTQLLKLSTGLTESQLNQTFDIGHRTLRQTYEHVIYNIDFWTSVMTGQPIPKPDFDVSRDTMIERHGSACTAFAAFARTIRDEQRLDDTFRDHFEQPMTFGGAILHVVLHDEDHRTEILHILERLGVPDLPEVDHGLWDFRRRGF
ncbi:MAG: DinB family protein [Thermomicrobiales bacterium]